MQAAAGALEDLRRSTSPEVDGAEQEVAVPRLVSQKRGRRNNSSSQQTTQAGLSSTSSPPMTEGDRALGAAEALVKAGSKRKSSSGTGASAVIEAQDRAAGSSGAASEAPTGEAGQRSSRARQSTRKGKGPDSVADMPAVPAETTAQQTAARSKGKRVARGKATDNSAADQSPAVAEVPPHKRRNSGTASSKSGAAAQPVVPAEVGTAQQGVVQEAAPGKQLQSKARGRSRLSKSSTAAEAPAATVQEGGEQQLPVRSRRGTKQSLPDTADEAWPDTAGPAAKGRPSTAAPAVTEQAMAADNSATAEPAGDETGRRQPTATRKRNSTTGAGQQPSSQHRGPASHVERRNNAELSGAEQADSGEPVKPASKRKSNAAAASKAAPVSKPAAVLAAEQAPQTAVKFTRKRKSSVAAEQNASESNTAQRDAPSGRNKRNRQSTPSLNAEGSGTVADVVKAGRESRYKLHKLAAVLRSVT